MAKKLEIVQPHQLAVDDATERARRNIEATAKQYGVKASTGELPFTLKGKGVAGTVNVNENDVQIKLELGLPASLMAGQIEKQIRDTIAKELAE